MDIISFTAVTLIFLSVCCGVLAKPLVSVEGAKNGVGYSFDVLIPSLFPFIFLSNFAVEYGISNRIGKLLAPFTEKVLYLPGEAGVTVFLSLVGGFPVGAVGINALYKQGLISEKQAQRMLWFCVNSGPAFLISVVGAELYNSEIMGIVLFVSQALSSLLLGIVFGLFARKKEPLQRNFTTAKTDRDFSSAFVGSAKNACISTVNLCALVILFSTFGTLFFVFFNIDKYSAIGLAISSLLEVTDGCKCLADSNMPIYLTALAVGWSGVCVHFQIFAAAESFGVKKMMFYFSRILNGAFTALLTFTAAYFLKLDSEVFSNLKNCETSITSNTFWGSAALLTASILFLIFMNSYIKTAKDNC